MATRQIEKKIKDISQKLFYDEPLLFNIFCTHTIVPNENIFLPMRSGKMLIEYSPRILENYSDKKIESLLKLELTRIALGHPYQRQPFNAKPSVLKMSSDAVIWQLNDFQKKSKNLLTKNSAQEKLDQDSLYFILNFESEAILFLRQQVGSFATFPTMNFEQWYKYFLDLILKAKNGQNVGDGFTNDFSDSNQAAELWQEDEEFKNEITSEIKKADDQDGFGSLGGNLERELKSQTDFSFDYRRALSQFRQSIVSPNRKLTRMRPSRRYGFSAMGSRYERKANVLIAVDVSGSITDESFEHFSTAIKNFFFLGIIEKIDLIFFDTELKLKEPIPFTKKIDLEKIKGRGGTSFLPPINYFFEHKSDYSGMIIFTDGEGDCPHFEKSSNILWILDSKKNYENSKYWISSLSGNKSTYLPF